MKLLSSKRKNSLLYINEKMWTFKKTISPILQMEYRINIAEKKKERRGTEGEKKKRKERRNRRKFQALAHTKNKPPVAPA